MTRIVQLLMALIISVDNSNGLPLVNITSPTTFPHGTTTSSLNDTKSEAVGYVSVAVAVFMLGSTFAPVKSFQTGDGIFFQWVFCVAVWICAMVVNAVRGFPRFFALNMLGGFLWETGNVMVVSIVKTLGLGLGLLLWGTTQVLVGWASGKWGWFGIAPEPVESATLNYIGVALATCSAITLVLVRPAHNSNNNQAVGERTPFLGGDNDASEGSPRINDNSGHSQSLPSNISGAIEEKPPDIIFTDRFSPTQKRIWGVAMSILSGVFKGLMFVPTLYVKKHYPQWYSNVSLHDVDHIFAHFSGILCTATVYFLIYCLVKKNKPEVYPSAILPGFASGMMWAIGMISYFLANDNLAPVISVPIISIGLGLVGSLWGVFFFKEIKGWRNYLILIVAILLNIGSDVFTSLSK